MNKETAPVESDKEMEGMAAKRPRVSVIMPSYNHEEFIGCAIRSVLEQTFQDFEIVITDDGSTDGSVNEIKKFEDPRISLFVFEENQGAAITMHNSAFHSKGDYIAVLNSDDVFMPEKLEKQVKFLDEHPDIAAVFSHVTLLDSEGNDFGSEKNAFAQSNRSRHEWLRHFFYKGNCLCHPSVLARRGVYTETEEFDSRNAQTMDFVKWIQLCMNHDIHIIEEPLVKFRVRSESVSGSNIESRRRVFFEYIKVLEHFLEIRRISEFKKIFPEASRFGEKLEDDLIPFYISMLALDVEARYPAFQNFAINVLYDMLTDKEMAARLEKDYGFRFADFIKLTGAHDLYNIEKETKLDVARRALEQKNSLLEEKNKKLEEKSKELEEKNGELKRSKGLIEEKKKELDREKDRVSALENSLSWKITSPLRKLAGPH